MRYSILCILVVALLAGVSVRADDMANYRQMMAQQKAQQQVFIKRMPELTGKKKLEDILKISSKHGKLELWSPLFERTEELRNQQYRAEVEGFEGDCVLSVQKQPRTENLFFSFSNTSYPALEGMSNFAVRLMPGNLVVSKNFSSRVENRTVSLVQSQGRGIYGSPDGVQLTAYASSNTGRVTTSINLHEPDFASMLRKHPREVDQFLRPLMRELKLDNLFAADDTTAWQVFSEEWGGNAEVAAEVKRLLPELDRDDYASREAARQALIRLGPDAALVVYRMDREGLSPEQRCQLDALLAQNWFLSRAEAKRLGTSVDFLLDCLYSRNEQIRQIAARRLGEKLHRELTLVTSEDYDARAKQVEALRAELGNQ